MSDPVTRLNAALEGRYAIERELGEGGMAMVYLALDLKHNRNVALKVLKPELAAVVGAERFVAEIETTANLQHPHILPLFDSGEADSFLFYVMPYVEGETLQERLDREKQLPIDEALGIATAVANALQTAHEAGIVHRDIKPANILLSRGEPLVADFGIALAVGAAGGNRLTETGLSVGTPFYMSPEQATGDQTIGPASDTYALACVLYEMLVGEPPYLGNTAQAVLGKIIQGLPVSATSVRQSVPANVDAALRKGLEKLPADRFTGAHEFAKALADPGFRHGEEAAVGVAAGAGQWTPLAMGLGALALLFGLGLGWSLFSPEPPKLVARFESPFRPGQAPIGSMEFTPDGSALVYVGASPSGGGTQLWIRRWENLEATPVPGTEGVSDPSYFEISPDGREVAFQLEPGESGPLLIAPLDDGPTRRIAEATWGVHGWTPEGMVYFQRPSDAISRVSATGGGTPEVVTELAGGETNHDALRLLPGGKTAVFTVYGGAEGTAIWALDLETGVRTMLTLGTSPRYAASGHLLFVRGDGTLMAAPIDEAAELGPAVSLVEGLNIFRGVVNYTVSQTGTLVYEAGSGPGVAALQQLVVVDLEGNETALVLAPRNIGSVGWSPDGQSVVYASENQIYTYNVTLGTTPRQITFDGNNFDPVFSPGGTRVAFASFRDGTEGTDLFVKNLDDDSPPRSIIRLPANQFGLGWPSDTLIVFERGESGNRNLWAVDLSDPDSARAKEFLTSEADLEHITVSPDGSLAAYRSDESGRDEIYIRSFPDPGEPTVVSQSGGRVPFWSPDGNTLYYVRREGPTAGTWMAARVQRNPVPVVLSTDSLFTIPSLEPYPGSGLHPDGDRFVILRSVGAGVTEADASETERVIMVQNFFEELKERVPN